MRGHKPPPLLCGQDLRKEKVIKIQVWKIVNNSREWGKVKYWEKCLICGENNQNMIRKL